MINPSLNMIYLRQHSVFHQGGIQLTSLLIIESIITFKTKGKRGKFWYDLITSIFITVEIIRSSSDHYIFTWNYHTYNYILAVKTHTILMATHHSIRFERLTQDFDNVLDYTFQECAKLKLFNITIIYIKYIIIIDQTHHIIKNIIQEYLATTTKRKSNFRNHPFQQMHHLKRSFNGYTTNCI